MTPAAKRQVIIGNSAGALSAIKGIREADRDCNITLISAEDCNAYSPVLLTYYLKGTRTREQLFIADAECYKSNNVRTMLGVRAVSVDAAGQAVLLENSKKVNYDNLLISVGAAPVSLSDPQEKLDNVFSLRTIADAEAILTCARTAKEATVIGAGLIGLQTADALARMGLKLTVMEWSRQVLPESVDAECAAIVQKELESRGVALQLSARVKAIKKAGKKAVIVLDNGEEKKADLVIVGVGLRPNVQLLGTSGVKVNRGIVVDTTLRTSVPNIFAAGDVTEGINLATGKPEVLPNWNNACRQGHTAGLNMAGQIQTYAGGLRETVTTVLGMTVAVVGMARAPEGSGVQELRMVDAERKTYRKVLLADNKIVGMVLLNKTSDAGILGNMIWKRQDFSPWAKDIALIPLDLRRALFLDRSFGGDMASRLEGVA